VVTLRAKMEISSKLIRSLFVGLAHGGEESDGYELRLRRDRQDHAAHQSHVTRSRSLAGKSFALATSNPLYTNFRPPDIADFRDGNHWRFALGGADQYLSAFFDGQDVTV